MEDLGVNRMQAATPRKSSIWTRWDWESSEEREFSELLHQKIYMLRYRTFKHYLGYLPEEENSFPASVTLTTSNR